MFIFNGKNNLTLGFYVARLAARTLKDHEERIKVLEKFCHKVESVLVLSVDFNPFRECSRDQWDQEILKYLVRKQRATTTMMAEAVNKVRRTKGLGPITRNACYFRLKAIQKKCEERNHPDLLTFNYKKNEEGLMRYWAIEPLVVDMLRSQIRELERQEKAEVLETPLL